jgi:hypothetical protein
MAQTQVRQSTGNKERQELPTILVYMADKRGQMLVESPVLGTISDISGSEKFVVVRDEMNDTAFAYRIVSSRDTLDAVAILPFERDEFEARLRVTIEGEIYKLSPGTDAMALLRNKRRWIQDAGCALAVLIEAAAQRRPMFTSKRIQRPRLDAVPENTPIQSIAEQWQLLAQKQAEAMNDPAPEGSEED